MKSTDNTVKLGRMRVEAGLGPNDVIGEFHFLFRGPLRAEALFDFILAPTAPQQPFPLRGGGAGDTKDCIKVRRGIRLKQQRNDHCRPQTPLCAPFFNLFLPDCPYSRMENAFQLSACGRIRKNMPCKFIPAQTAILPYHPAAKHCLDFRQSRLARFNKVPGDGISVRDGQTAFVQQFGGGGFAHANAAG